MVLILATQFIFEVGCLTFCCERLIVYMGREVWTPMWTIQLNAMFVVLRILPFYKLMESCQPHSEVPQKDEDWPSLDTILSFRERVRERLTTLYADISNGTIKLTRKVARVLFMTYEHEGLHVEVNFVINYPRMSF